jgi:2-isopropylmalate synthase
MSDATQVRRVQFFDTTLRDGEQAPGAAMATADKCRVAALLEELRVDVIEAGFAASNDAAAEAIQLVSGVVTQPTICSLARAVEGDIIAAHRALRTAKRSRVHIFLATERNHMAVKLGLSPQEVITRAYQSVRQATALFDEVEFSPEVASKTDPSFLYEVIDAVVSAGARIVNIPDTVGYLLPDAYGRLVASVLERAAPSVRYSVHCHDDLGCATASSLAGLAAGATQVECTINGIGERAGNASLEEIAVAIAVHSDTLGLYHTLDLSVLNRLSRLVAEATRIPVAPNKAVVGKNAFAHESGIHQAGVIKSAALYELVDPALVGAVRQLPLGRLSGRHGLGAALTRLGYQYDIATLALVYELFLDLATQQVSVTDADLHRLMERITV